MLVIYNIYVFAVFERHSTQWPSLGRMHAVFFLYNICSFNKVWWDLDFRDMTHFSCTYYVVVWPDLNLWPISPKFDGMSRNMRWSDGPMLNCIYPFFFKYAQWLKWGGWTTPCSNVSPPCLVVEVGTERKHIQWFHVLIGILFTVHKHSDNNFSAVDVFLQFEDITYQ